MGIEPGLTKHQVGNVPLCNYLLTHWWHLHAKTHTHTHTHTHTCIERDRQTDKQTDRQREKKPITDWEKKFTIRDRK